MEAYLKLGKTKIKHPCGFPPAGLESGIIRDAASCSTGYDLVSVNANALPLDFATQYKGENNGDLRVAWKSQETLTKAKQP